MKNPTNSMVLVILTMSQLENLISSLDIKLALQEDVIEGFRKNLSETKKNVLTYLENKQSPAEIVAN